MDLREAYDKKIETMSIEDLPNDDLRDVAEVCGIEIALRIMKKLSGSHIYVPHNSFSKIAFKFIVENFDGSNAKKLSQVTGISLCHVYTIIRNEDKKRSENKKKTNYKQLDLFAISTDPVKEAACG